MIFKHKITFLIWEKKEQNEVVKDAKNNTSGQLVCDTKLLRNGKYLFNVLGVIQEDVSIRLDEFKSSLVESYH